jgi:UDP-2-acetamido-3-amino-2,3-dideoxy-glucuronate N-acetyltransferase
MAIVTPESGALATAADVRCSPAQEFPGPDADLVVYDNGMVLPFAARRVFTVRAREAAERGRHAHKLCRQVFVCLQGTCTVTIDDGSTRKTFVLSTPREALYVPASIWAEQDYEPGAVLMVLCDQPFDESDYIRDYDVFLSWRAEAA